MRVAALDVIEVRGVARIISSPQRAHLTYPEATRVTHAARGTLDPLNQAKSAWLCGPEGPHTGFRPCWKWALARALEIVPPA